ncbi:hypothetical protein J7K56_04925 [Candidatus Calescamantes bacterium]|nr:hypothetical protein [Candidatus Calescamantes bacterium]
MEIKRVVLLVVGLGLSMSCGLLVDTKAYAEASILVTSFETPREVKKWSASWGHNTFGTEVSWSNQYASDGTHSMKVVFKKAPDPKICHLIKGWSRDGCFPEDWSGYDVFSFDVYLETRDIKHRWLSIWICDKEGNLQEEERNPQKYTTKRILRWGWNTITISISEIAKKIDVHKVKTIRLMMNSDQKDKVLYFDNFRLIIGRLIKEDGLIKDKGNGCSIEAISKEKVVIKNNFIKVTILSRGGRISEYIYLPTNHHFFAHFRGLGGLKDYCWISKRPTPGDWYSVPYQLEIIKDSPEVVSIMATGERIVDGFKIQIKRKMSIFKGSTKLLIETECKNLSNQKIESLYYGIHPELTPGGEVIKEKQLIFTSVGGKIRKIFLGNGSHPTMDIPDIDKGWIIGANQENQEMLKLSFDQKQFRNLHIFILLQPPMFYNFELFFKPVALAPGQTANFRFSFSIHKGLSAVTGANENLVWNVKPASSYALKGCNLPINIEVSSNKIEEDKVLVMKMLPPKGRPTWQKRIRIPFFSFAKPFLYQVEIKNIEAEGTNLFSFSIMNQKNEVLAKAGEKIEVCSPDVFFTKYLDCIEEKERYYSLLKEAKGEIAKILKDKKRLEQQIKFLKYKVKKLETSKQSLSLPEREKGETFLGKPPLVGFTPSWVVTFDDFVKHIQLCKDYGFNVTHLRSRHERNFTDEEMVEMARLCRENKIYFSFSSPIQHTNLYVDPKMQKWHLTHLMYGWKNKETIRKIVELGGKYCLGIFFPEPANDMGFFDGSGTTEEECFRQWEEAVSNYVRYFKENFGAAPIPEERYTLVPYWYRNGCQWQLPELTETGAANTDIRLAMLRGAGRAYEKPWGTHISLWYNGVPLADGPTPDGKGHTIATFKKAIYLSYVSGANIIELEGHWQPRGKYVKELSYMKKKIIDKLGYAGEPYTPCAVMLSLENGWYPGRDTNSGSWGILPPDKADHMVNTCLNIFYPGYWDSGRFDERTGYFVPTPLGNIDIIWDDMPLEKIKKYYKAVILLGPHKIEGELEEKLKRYVQDGGILAINAAQLNKDKPSFLGLRLTGKKHLSQKTILMPNKILGVEKQESWSEYPFKVLEIKYSKDFTVVARDDKNYPILLTRTFGKGRIWVTTPEYLITESQPYEYLKIAKILFAKIAYHFKAVFMDKDEKIEYMLSVKPERLLLLVINNDISPWEGKIKVKKMLGDKKYKVVEVFSGNAIDFQEIGKEIIFKSKIEPDSLKMFNIHVEGSKFTASSD